MRFAHFDPFAGASGDMILGALVDAGLPLEDLVRELGKLGLSGYRLEAEPVRRGVLAGTKVHVRLDDDGPDLPSDPHSIETLFLESALAPGVRERAAAVVRILAAAEAAVHGVEPSQAHFHEVGRLDAMVDIAGSVAGLALLGVEHVTSSTVATGSGEVRCSHGRLPVPAPATAEILRNVPTVAHDSGCEMTTPTGAALLTGLSKAFGPRPAGVVEAVGYGAGGREAGPLPNLLRLFVGRSPAREEPLVEVEANLDDMTPELLGPLLDRLVSAGARDAWMTAVHMKKGRPGIQVTALCDGASVAAVESLLFAETSTLGVRRRRVERTTLPREVRAVRTPFGPIRVKVGFLPGGASKHAPEFEDCRAAAEGAGRPLREVYEAASRAFVQGDFVEPSAEEEAP